MADLDEVELSFTSFLSGTQSLSCWARKISVTVAMGGALVLLLLRRRHRRRGRGRTMTSFVCRSQLALLSHNPSLLLQLLLHAVDGVGQREGHLIRLELWHRRHLL
jgi:hypothetical protein